MNMMLCTLHRREKFRLIKRQLHDKLLFFVSLELLRSYLDTVKR